MNKIVLIILLFSCNTYAQITLSELIRFGTKETCQSQNIDLRKQILDAKLASFRSSLGWQLGVGGQIPAYAKSNFSTVQNDGNIAFQSVNYNNSSIGAKLSKTIWQTGGELQFTSGLQRFDNFNTKQHNYNGIPIRISFKQNLLSYNPYKWEKKNYQIKKEINHRQSKVDKMIIRLDIARAFFDVLIAQNEISSNENDVLLSKDLMNIAKVQDSLGTISKKQFLQLELQLKMAQSQLNIAQSQLLSSKTILRGLLNNEKNLDGKFEIPTPSGINLDVDSIINLAKANRPEWLEYQRRIQEQVETVKAESRRYGPSVGLNASIGMIRSDVELAPIYNDAQQDQSIGLSFNVPIFDSRLKRNKIHLAKLELEEQKNRSQLATLRLENDIKKLAMEFEACQARLDYAKEIKNIATENLRITTQTFKQGLVGIAELNLAIQDKNRASRNFIAETRRYWLLYFELFL